MIHQLADVQSKTIGKGTDVWQFCVVLEGAKIGNNCNINAQCLIENDVVIGDNVTVKSGVQVWDGITLEDNVFIGPNVTFINDIKPRSKHYPENFVKTIIQQNATLGANCTILGGITVGRNAMIGAASILTKNVPNNTLWYGSPASFHQYICNCGKTLDENLKCRKCGGKFMLNDSGIIEMLVVPTGSKETKETKERYDSIPLIRETIEETLVEVLEQTGNELLVSKLTNEVILLESGLDSLGFAILVATLEAKLEYDPFIMMDKPIYPSTFGEFVNIYEKHYPNS